MADAPPTSFDQLDYTLDLDDRVVCNGCPHEVKQVAQEFTPLDKARSLRERGEAIGFAGDRIETRGKWVVASWMERVCGLGALCAPAGVMHRCSLIKPPGYPGTKTQPKAVTSTAQAEQGTDQWWNS